MRTAAVGARDARDEEAGGAVPKALREAARRVAGSLAGP